MIATVLWRVVLIIDLASCAFWLTRGTRAVIRRSATSRRGRAMPANETRP